MSVTVRVPATSANLGPGFDCFGLALALYNDVTLVPDTPFALHVAGEGVERLARDRNNLVCRTIDRFFAEIGRPAPPFSLRLHNRIPMSGGLGSSSTAIVGGLMAANAVAGGPCTTAELLRLAMKIEGHPDNVAPALLGGFIIASLAGDEVVTASVPVPRSLRAVVFAPDFSIPTHRAREILPASVPRADAIFNVGRAALWVGALVNERFDLLRLATEDRLHQPYRQTLFPALPRLIEAALTAGAHGAFLSGAGASVMAICTSHQVKVGSAMCDAAARAGVNGRALFVDVARQGAAVISA